MRAADYIVGFLARNGVTDAFGIPGGVVLELLYAMERTPGITPHLCYHEQGAAFAASGYGQYGKGPGVAFATCGPGITNTLTPVADAYADSTPMLVFTAHSVPKKAADRNGIRFLHNQEMELGPVFASAAKAYVCVDEPERLTDGLLSAFLVAMTGRKGPVVVDILSGLFARELPDEWPEMTEVHGAAETECMCVVADISRRLAVSRRPVLLLGEGVKRAGVVPETAAFAEKNEIPVISSRYAQDIMPRSPMYFGYIGTHAVRAANFILSKADLIVALGNRLAFPTDSASFRPLAEHTTIVRTDIDAAEFGRRIPGTVDHCADLKELMPALLDQGTAKTGRGGWLAVCERLRGELKDCDVTEPVRYIAEMLSLICPEAVVTGDVGNNEMWLSRGYQLAGVTNRILYSGSFGALGCSLPKAIGAHYASGAPVLCFTGDQGLQMNLQELQTVASNRLPILISVLNNRSSGMIRDHEQAGYGGHVLFVTEDSGYTAPNLERIAAAYGIAYYEWKALTPERRAALLRAVDSPALLEVSFSEEIDVAPQLKRGDPCQKLFPYLDAALYQELDAL